MFLRRLFSGLKIPSSRVPIRVKFKHEDTETECGKENNIFEMADVGHGKVFNVSYGEKPVPFGCHLNARYALKA